MKKTGQPTTAAKAAGKFACLLMLLIATAQSAEMLEFKFERKGPRYTVHSEAYIDIAPEGVFQVLSDYDRLHLISNLVEESRELRPGENGERLVYTKNSGCLALFCRTVEKVERLEAVPPVRIITVVIPQRSDVSFSRSEWRLAPDGRGTRLSYAVETEVSFWVPPVIGNYLLSRWLRKGAVNALQRIEYYAWHALYGEDKNQPQGES